MEIPPRERIRQSALQLFANNGFEKISIRDIAQHASVNISMISYYFESKENLLCSFLTEAIESNNTLLSQLNTAINPLEQLQTFLRFYLDYYLHHWHLFAIMVQQQTLRNSTELQNGIRQWKSLFYQILHNILLRGTKDHSFRECDTALSCTLAIGFLNEYIVQYIVGMDASPGANDAMPDSNELQAFEEEMIKRILQ